MKLYKVTIHFVSFEWKRQVLFTLAFKQVDEIWQSTIELRSCYSF